MLFSFEYISNDRNQERKLNNNPNWLERCNSIELSFSTNRYFPLPSHFLNARKFLLYIETTKHPYPKQSTYHLVQMIVINVHCLFPERTKVIHRYLSIFPQTLCLCPFKSLFPFLFFFFNFHSDIVIRHCYTSSKYIVVVYSIIVEQVKFSSRI